MNSDYYNRTELYMTQNRLRNIRNKIMRVLAVITVFCTTYALILPAVTFESQVGNTLNGDYAYISSVKINNTVDGTNPFDGDDLAGNDMSPTNIIIRSFDLLSYTMQVTSKTRENSPYSSFKSGTLYCEFILPVNNNDAIFDTGKMTWLKDSQITEITYNGKPAQKLRGSYLWQASENNLNVIGNGWVQLDVYIRIIAMTQGEKLAPIFTFWLEGNTVTDNGPVTGSELNNNNFFTVASQEITVSSAPRFNIKLVDGGQQNLDTFDFSTGNAKAFNQNKGVVTGRRSNYGIILQIRGVDEDHGLRGCELPDGNDITFDLDVSSVYTNDSANSYNTENIGCAPLIWSFDANLPNTYDRGQQDGRIIAGTHQTMALNAPINALNSGAGGAYNSCKKGGNWQGSLSSDGKTLSITVSGYEIDLNQIPYASTSNTENEFTFYNPDTISGYWDIAEASFSSGELWIVQPFYDNSGQEIAGEYGNGSFTLTLESKKLRMSGKGTALTEKNDNSNQTATNDDKCALGVALSIEGSISYNIALRKLRPSTWDDALTEGCWRDGKDWVAAGGQMGVFDWIVHQAEDGDIGVAYDQLIKFDSDYFIPYSQNFETSAHGLDISVGYAVVAAGSDKGSPESGWNHNGKAVDEEGYDDCMKVATADDLIFYKDLADIRRKGYKCVGVLFEFRGCCDTSEFHSDREVTGFATTNTSLAGDVFMVTHSASIWTKNDIKDLAAEYFGKSASELTNNDYAQYAKEKIPSRLNETNIGTNIKYADSYPKYPNNFQNIGTNGTNQDLNEGYKTYKKSVYNTNGWVSGSSGTNYGDSCLLVAYTMEIDKSVAQTSTSSEGQSVKKTVYSINDGQRCADFQLIAASNVGYENLNNSSESLFSTTVTVKDILPKGLNYVDDSSYYGGTYQQTGEGRQGIVNGGTLIKPTVTNNADGTTTLEYKLENVSIDMNQKTVLEPIFYSCTIGDTVDIVNDVKDKEQLTNTATISSTEDCTRPFSSSNKNSASCTIVISRLNLGNISKLADEPYVDIGKPIGYTMAIGNSGADYRDIVALDILPYNGGNGTSFNDESCASQVTELTLKKNTEYVDFSQISVYYTENPNVRSTTSNAYGTVDESTLTAGGWTKLTVESIGTISLPEAFSPTAILFKGKLGGQQTLGIHITIALAKGTVGDYAVNCLYESGGLADSDELKATASTYLVTRSFEGFVWADINADGIQNTEENGINNVKVTLYKLKDGGDPGNFGDYDPFILNTEPVTVLTGHSISLLGGESLTYEPGRYKFSDLPAGIYAVRFEDSEDVKISGYIASPKDKGNNDALDSDGTAVYLDDRSALQYTYILNIVMPQAKDMGVTDYNSPNYDSGFYERGYEMPKTGGKGTDEYTVAGLLLWGFAFLMFVYRKAQKQYGRRTPGKRLC